MKTLQDRAVTCLIAGLSLTACLSPSTEVVEEDAIAVQSESLQLNRACKDSFNSVYAQPQNLPRYSDTSRGDVIRCAPGRTIGVQELSNTLANRAFMGITVQKAVQLFRITYRTERINRLADVSSALVVLPSDGTPRSSFEAGADTESTTAIAQPQTQAQTDANRNRKRMPLVVFGHGTVPYGQSCAYSKTDPGGESLDTELGSLLALATHGYPVIMPDYAGFVTGSPSAGYLLSEDEAHSLLDATRAMSKLLRDSFDRVVFVGHSQGGHAVLSAQALARSYGMSGQLVGVAAMAPFWAPGRTFGAIVSPELMFNTHDNPGELSFAIEYFYTHAELYDGRGRGAALFTSSAQAALPGFVSSCSFTNDPSVLGNLPSDFFQASFLNAVAPCGVNGGAACNSGLAATWEKRFRADRPKLDASGSPIVLWQGANDLVINPLVAKCGIDKIAMDLPANNRTAKFTQCGDAVADHENLLSNQMGWVTRWIDARALGTSEPAACQTLESITGPLECLTPPGNQD